MRPDDNFGGDEKRIDELVEMIDKLMAEGGGHVNVNSEAGSAQGEDTLCVETYRSSDKSMNIGACCEPTADFDHDELDDDEF